MNTIDAIIEGLVKREGGYVDHPDDTGGATCWGITEKLARRWGYAGAMKDLPVEEARRIYRDEFINGVRFNEILALHEHIGEEVIDTGVNMGQEVAATLLQRSLNALNLKGEMFPDIAVDGHVGDGTIAALKSFLAKRGGEGAAVLLKTLNCLQGARYVELCEKRGKNESFLYGWMRQRVG